MKFQKLTRFTALLLVLMLCSCSVDYNLEVKKDGSLIETISAKEDNKKLSKLGFGKPSRVIEMLLFDEMINIRDYRVTDNTKDNTDIRLYRVFKDINEYEKKSIVYKLYPDSFNIVTNRSIVEITQKKNLKLPKNYKDMGIKLDKINVNLQLPDYLVKGTSAKYKNKTYKFNDNSKMYIIYDKRKRRTHYNKYIFLTIILFVLILFIQKKFKRRKL